MSKTLLNMLGHTGLGLVIMLVVFAATQDIWLGYAVQAGYWFGRERRDHEIKSKIPVREWYKGWNFFTWSTDGKRDLLVPLIVNAMIAFGIYYLMK